MAREPYPSELLDRFLLRFPEGLKERAAQAAKANKRSLNAEIIARLEESLDRSAGGLDDYPIFILHLDTEGRLTSWREIQAHFAAIEKVTGTKPWGLNISVFTPDMESSLDRTPEAEKLEADYKSIATKG